MRPTQLIINQINQCADEVAKQKAVIAKAKADLKAAEKVEYDLHFELMETPEAKASNLALDAKTGYWRVYER